MEQLENMERIEALQTELGLYLSSIIPVPWEKICFYADAAPDTASEWFAFIEKETGVICTQELFWKRFESYAVEKTDAVCKLLDLTELLYNAYVERFGQEKAWRTMYYTLQSDGAVHIDLEYELPSGDMVERRNTVYRRFFNCERKKSPKGKYPATE
ncbi:MAG: DUF600 family protein [Oscillospiraceae bacterium]|nr:DUF600 family protein [Oscillospiraceae bacterium]